MYKIVEFTIGILKSNLENEVELIFAIRKYRENLGTFPIKIKIGGHFAHVKKRSESSRFPSDDAISDLCVFCDSRNRVSGVQRDLLSRIR